jgi:uncharacterized membrane protein YkvA (DUF1232 family)
MLQRLRSRARTLKRETIALYFAVRDPRTPWYAKALTFFVVAHTFSPIDLIPDFIPVLGYLDDLVITPAGIWLAVRLIPPDVLARSRIQANKSGDLHGRIGIIGAVIIILVWLASLAWVLYVFGLV